MEENFDIFDFELDDARHERHHRAEPRRAHRSRPGPLQLHPELTPDEDLYLGDTVEDLEVDGAPQVSACAETHAPA